MRKESDWSSINIVKLCISILTPLLLFWLGVIVSESAQQTERSLKALEQEREQTGIQIINPTYF